MEETRTPRQVQ